MMSSRIQAAATAGRRLRLMPSFVVIGSSSLVVSASTPAMDVAASNEFLWIWRMEDGVVVEAEAFLDLVAYREVIRNSRPSAPFSTHSQ